MEQICPLLSIAEGECTYCLESECKWFFGNHCAVSYIKRISDNLADYVDRVVGY